MHLRLNSLHKNIDIYAQMDIYLLLTLSKGQQKQSDLQTKYFISCKIKGVGFTNENEINLFFNF